MTKTCLKIGAGILAASFALAGCGNVENENPAYCYDDSGQTVLSGYLGADGGKFIAHYQDMKLVGYQENKTSIQDNNAKVQTLCAQISRGEIVKLSAPQ